jgi:hypothetical protein
MRPALPTCHSAALQSTCPASFRFHQFVLVRCFRTQPPPARTFVAVFCLVIVPVVVVAVLSIVGAIFVVLVVVVVVVFIIVVVVVVAAAVAAVGSYLRLSHQFPAYVSDYLPTFLDVLGVQHPQPTWAHDGVSLLPLIQAAAAQPASQPIINITRWVGWLGRMVAGCWLIRELATAAATAALLYDCYFFCRLLLEPN